jgi:hypothetical protein
MRAFVALDCAQWPQFAGSRHGIMLWQLFQRRLDGGECRAQLQPKTLDHGDDRDRMPAAIKPYSIAVAAVSSRQKSDQMQLHDADLLRHGEFHFGIKAA